MKSKTLMKAAKTEEQAKTKFTRLIQENETAKQVAHITQIFLKNITQALPQYVFWKDVSSVYLGCNSNYAHLVGLNSPEEIIGKKDNDFHWQSTGHTAETFQRGDQDTIMGRPITNQEETLVLPNGNKLSTLVSKLPIIDNGKVLGIVGYFTDITELKNKEIELIKAKKQAETANEAKSVFLTNISHDLRTPLAGMIGMIHILMKEIKSEEGQEAGTNLLKASHLLLDLLNEIIEVTRSASENLPVYEVKFDLKTLIDKVVTLETPSVKQKGLIFKTNYDKSIPMFVIGDQRRIHRILLNLISNAVKFTMKGEIEVTVKLAKQKRKTLILKLLVKDTGIGISTENQQIIFSRFTRLDAAYKGNYKGSGLGLSIVKQFISDIEGEIYVESEIGKGSTFTCILPLKKALLEEVHNTVSLMIENTSEQNLKRVAPHYEINENEVASETETIIKSHQFNIRVLLVEDNAIAQMAAKSLLKELGCEVITADTGEIALERFKKDKFDVVFMDIGLPGKDGCEVTQELRLWEEQKGQYTPIVALTGHVDENNQQQCINVGMEKVITKPLIDKLARKVLELVVPKHKLVNLTEKRKINMENENMPVIDLVAAATILNSSEAQAKKMLSMLVETLAITESDIKSAFQSSDLKKLQFIVHNLRGGASYCGVPRLKNAAKTLEDFLQMNAVNQIEMGYKQLLTEINNVLQESKRVQ